MPIVLMMLLFMVSCAQNSAPKTSYLYVQLAQSGTLSPDLLTLNNIDEKVLYFSDRPIRQAGHITIGEFIANWKHGKDSLEKIPPNAAIEIREGDKHDVFVVELSHPHFNAAQHTLTYQVHGLQVLPTARSFEHVSIFIDDQSLPACNASDQKVAIYPANQEFWVQTHTCAKSSLGNAEKTAHCLIGYYPDLSSSCAQGIGEMTHCVAAHCLFKCMFNQKSEGCVSCASQNCDPSTYTGIADDLLPKQ